MPNIHPLADQWVREIALDHHSGAALLTRKTLDAFEDVARSFSDHSSKEQLDVLMQMGRLIESYYPDMAPIENCVEALLKTLITEEAKQIEAVEFTDAALQTVEKYRQRLEKSARAVIEHGLKRMQGMKQVLTISSSSTLQGALKAVWERGNSLHVIAMESLPGGEGRHYVEQLGKHAELITDLQAAKYIKQCDAVIVGADCVAETYFINKVGTHFLALGAKEFSVPFYVLTESDKYTKKNDRTVPLGSVFEKIPLDLVTSVVTDLSP